jgi:hypothetical protein
MKAPGISVTLARRFEHCAPDRLVPYSRNAKQHSIAQVDELVSIILKVGFVKPVIVDEEYTVLAGHGARLAAIKIGLPEIPVVVLSHLSAAEKRAYVLADNRIAEHSTWDLGVVAEELAALDLEKFDFTMTGFSDEDLEQMLDDLAGLSSTPATKPDRGTTMSTDPKTAQAPAAAPAAAAPPAAAAVPPSLVTHVESDLTADKKAALTEIKGLALELHTKIHALEAAGSREIAIAKTKIEEAVHWVGAHLHKSSPPAAKTTP